MFNNKRRNFHLESTKTYGLASAVIAAFFLAGGVAHADESNSNNNPGVAQRQL